MAPGRLDGVSDPVTLVARDPDLAWQRAEGLLEGDCDPATRAAALRMLAGARRESGDVRAAERLLRRSAALAARVGDREHAAHARASRLGVLALRGGGGMAADALARLSAQAASTHALLLTHQGVAAAQHGRFGAAVAGFDAALAALDGERDSHLLPGVLSNRGLALMYEGRLEESAADLADALRHTEERGQACLSGITLQNLGCLAVRRGDLARAVSCFEAAENLVPRQRVPSVRLDHADALLAGGMHKEAARLLNRLGRGDRLGPTGAATGDAATTTEAATAGLLQAKVYLARGDAEGAGKLARRLRRAFAADSLWAHLARLVEWSARHSAVPQQRSTPALRHLDGPGQISPRRTTERATASPTETDSRSGPPERRRGRVGDAMSSAASPIALPAGVDADCAATAATAAAVAHCVYTAPAGPLSLALPSPQETAALRALAAGDHRASREHLLRRPTPPFPARHLELLAHARAHRREVAAAGARLALRDKDAATALEWVEFATAPTLPTGPCRDRTWLALLERCRQAHVRAGGGDPAAQRELWSAADRLSLAQWHPACMDAEDAGDMERPVTAPLAERLADRALVRYARIHGRDAVITVVDGRTRLHPLPPADATEDAVAKLAYAARARMLAGADGRPRPGFAHGGRRDGIAAAAAAVDRLLTAPVAEAVGDRPLVVVPPHSAQALPWGLLPSMRGREVSVVPSARAWLARCDRTAGRGGGRGATSGGDRADRRRVLLAAGDAPGGAAAEVRSLREAYPAARVLHGREARVAAVLRELERCDTAHLAAHGSVSPQTPMLAGLHMQDGPLFAYDAERLSRAPEVTVLSSCWVGGSAPAASGMPLGMAASLLAMGGGVVVAGVLPVSDHGITAAMLAFHTALRAGERPARAVADHLAEAGFVCYGAG